MMLITHCHDDRHNHTILTIILLACKWCAKSSYTCATFNTLYETGSYYTDPFVVACITRAVEMGNRLQAVAQLSDTAFFGGKTRYRFWI